jgi:hypothetical protein
MSCGMDAQGVRLCSRRGYKNGTSNYPLQYMPNEEQHPLQNDALDLRGSFPTMPGKRKADVLTIEK